MLFAGLKALAVVEAKRTSHDVAGDLEQARIMTDHMATELAEQDALEGWQYSETLTMVLEDMGTISGRIELIELRALPNPEVLP